MEYLRMLVVIAAIIWTPRLTGSSPIGEHCNSYSGSWERMCTLVSRIKEAVKESEEYRDIMAKLEQEISSDREKWFQTLTNIHLLTLDFQNSKEDEIKWLNSTLTQANNEQFRLKQELMEIRNSIIDLRVEENVDNNTQSLQMSEHNVQQAITYAVEKENDLSLRVHESEVNTQRFLRRLSTVKDMQYLLQRQIGNLIPKSQNLDAIFENNTSNIGTNHESLMLMLNISFLQTELLQNRISLLSKNHDDRLVLLLEHHDERIKKLTEKFDSRLDKITEQLYFCKASEGELKNKLNLEHFNRNILNFKHEILKEKIINNKCEVHSEREAILPLQIEENGFIDYNDSDSDGGYNILMKYLERLNSSVNNISLATQKENMYGRLIAEILTEIRNYQTNRKEIGTSHNKNIHSLKKHEIDTNEMKQDAQFLKHLKDKQNEIRLLEENNVKLKHNMSRNEEIFQKREIELLNKVDELQGLVDSTQKQCTADIKKKDDLLDTALKKIEHLEKTSAKAVKVKLSDVALSYTAGDNLTITCDAEGLPSPQVQWYIGHQYKLETNDRVQVSDNHTLHINGLRVEDTAAYTCYAENKYSFNTDTKVVYVHKGCIPDIQPTVTLEGSSFYLSSEAMTWDDASAFCANSSCMRLLSLETHSKQELITNYLISINWNFYTWTSGRKIDGFWRWTSSKKPFTYTNWHPSQPNNVGSNQDCVELYKSHYMWMDSLCSDRSRFICEYF